MKLRFLNFKEAKLLLVSDHIDFHNAQVLVAGITKLLRLNQSDLIIDLTNSVFDQKSIKIFISSLYRNLDDLSRINKTLKSSPKIIGWQDPSFTASSWEEFCKVSKSKFIYDLHEIIELEEEKNQYTDILMARDYLRENFDLEKIDMALIRASEEYWKSTNSNLRIAQTSLINQVIDPVYSDLDREEIASDELIKQFESHLLNKPSLAVDSSPQENHLSEVQSSQPDESRQSSDQNLYMVSIYSDIYQNLESELATLKIKMSQSLPREYDRLTSLILENQKLIVRIDEISNLWISQLLNDIELTRGDWELGLKPLIEESLRKAS